MRCAGPSEKPSGLFSLEHVADDLSELLKALNQGAVKGVLYNGDAHLCDLAQELLKRLN